MGGLCSCGPVSMQLLYNRVPVDQPGETLGGFNVSPGQNTALGCVSGGYVGRSSSWAA